MSEGVQPPVAPAGRPARDVATSPRELAERVAAAALAVPGVAGLHPGALGEVATYLPGRRVVGVRTENGSVSVHVSVELGSDIRTLAETVRAAVARAGGGGQVHVVVEDVVPAEPRPAAPADPDDLAEAAALTAAARPPGTEGPP